MSARSIRRRQRLSLAAGLVLALMVLVAGCGGSTSSTSGDPAAPAESDTTSIDPLVVERHSDPAQPIGVAIGRRFELLLPADPTRGWRWVLEPFDTAVVVALSSTFVDDPTLLNSTTTVPGTDTGTAPDTGTGTAEPTVTLIPTTTTTIDPDSPEAAPLVQIITFAGRSLATTAIKLRYEPIGENTADPRTVTFTVVVYAEQS